MYKHACKYDHNYICISSTVSFYSDGLYNNPIYVYIYVHVHIYKELYICVYIYISYK